MAALIPPRRPLTRADVHALWGFELALHRKGGDAASFDVVNLARLLHGKNAGEDRSRLAEMRHLMDVLEEHQDSIPGWTVTFLYRSKRRTVVCRRASTQALVESSTAASTA